MSTIPDSLEDELKQRLQEVKTRIVGSDTPLYEVTRNRICDTVSNEVAVQLESEFNLSIKSPVKAKVDGQKHFVAGLVETPQNGVLNTPIILDGTVQQFGESYPETVVTPLNSSKASELYDIVEFSQD